MHTGTKGEQEIQKDQGSTNRANKFYHKQMKTHLTESMAELINKQEMVFISTSDAAGNCDCSPRFGKAGFISIIDKHTLAYPEYKGNGVFASLGNMLENPKIGMVFIDFFNTTVGLHINGTVNSHKVNDLPVGLSDKIKTLAEENKLKIERWVIIKIDEAYIHCSKHVPKLSKEEKKISWGTDDDRKKSSDFFIKGSKKELLKNCGNDLLAVTKIMTFLLISNALIQGLMYLNKSWSAFLDPTCLVVNLICLFLIIVHVKDAAKALKSISS